jgi:rubredoxin
VHGLAVAAAFRDGCGFRRRNAATALPLSCVPQYAETGAPAVVHAWTAEELPVSWVPPDCLGWSKKKFSAVIAVAGRIEHAGERNVLLRRLGSVSEMTSIRYWSTTRGVWRKLYSESIALSGPDPELARQDFSALEVRTGQDYYIWQKENSPASGMVYKMRFRQLTEDRIVVEQVNISPARVLAVTALEACAFETVHFFEREKGDVWLYYSLSRIGESNAPVRMDGTASVVNRLVSVYRYLAGIRTDRDPPAMP